MVYQQWRGHGMLFCKRNKLRTTSKVQNTTLKSYGNAKKNLETPIGAMFWYQCLKFTCKPPNIVWISLNLLSLARIAFIMICNGWPYPYLHNPTDTDLGASLDIPGLKQPTVYSQNNLICAVCSSRDFPGCCTLCLSQPHSGLGTPTRKTHPLKLLSFLIATVLKCSHLSWQRDWFGLAIPCFLDSEFFYAPIRFYL